MHVATNDTDVNYVEDQQIIDALRSRKPDLAETRVYVDPTPGPASVGHTFNRRTNLKTLERDDSPEQRDSWNRVWTFFEWHLRPYAERLQPKAIGGALTWRTIDSSSWRRGSPSPTGRVFVSETSTPATRKGFRRRRKRPTRCSRRRSQQISSLQETLYAQDQWGVLLIFQAMDAAGKDSAIKHVFSGINPQGVQVFSFKAPSAEELDHDFLWRTTVRLPERGRIGVFNRSYYEEVLVVRVHPELLQSERLPEQVVGRSIWSERFDDINAFERHLARSGYLIRKFFLHVSREEQARRFLKRLDEPEKRWKFSMGDIRERERWQHYMKAYEDDVQQHQHGGSALGGRAGGQEVVRPAGDCRRGARRARGARAAPAEGLGRTRAGAGRGAAALARELGERDGRQGGARKKR